MSGIVAPPDKYPDEFLQHVSWYEKHLIVIDDKSRRLPFKLWPTQVFLEFLKWRAMKRREVALLIILKSRRQGIYTWDAGTFFRDGYDMPDRRTLIIAHDDKATRNVLSMTRLFHQEFPEKITTERDSAVALKFKHNRSEFITYTAGARENTARSFGCQAIQFSEVDSYPDARVFTSAMQVLPNEYPGVCIMESTAKGPEGPFQEHWDRAVAGESGFTPVFLPWFDDPRYQMDYSYGDIVRFGPRDYVKENERKLKAFAIDDEYVKERRQKHGLGPSPGGQTLGEGDGGVGGRIQREDPKGRRGKKQETEGEARKGPESEPVPPGDVGTEGTSTGADLPGAPRWRNPDLRQDYDGPGPRRDGAGVSHRDGSKRAADSRRRIRHAQGLTRVRADQSLDRIFRESYDPYEDGLEREFGEVRVSPYHIAWLRWIRAVKCGGDELERKREYPSRPDEAFEAAGDSVLNPVILAEWMKLAETENTTIFKLAVSEDEDGRLIVLANEDPLFGHTRVWEKPEEGKSYVMGVDPAGGVKDGDWVVASVLERDTGIQVAEYRSREEPDPAINEIEALGIWYNEAFTGVEANTFGMPYVRSLEDRQTLPMFEREVPDRREPGKTNKMIGWLTYTKTREMLLMEVRRCFREDICRIRSVETLKEGRTLTVRRTEKGAERIEARTGCHDDGIFGYGIALMMRNRVMPMEVREMKRDEETP
jgi:hypothetical protein